MTVRLFFIAIILAFAASCSSDDDTAEVDAGGEDVGPDIDAELDPDVEPEPDAQSDADADVEGECLFQIDCDDDQYCHQNECHEAPECNSPTQYGGCVAAYSEVDEALGRRAFCDGSHCRVACLTDQECPDSQLCTDDGVCVPFTGELTGHHPGGDEAAPLQAGIGEALMHFPIGLPLGGFGNRSPDYDTRYSDSLAGSHGKMHGLYARGVALDSGDRQLLFLRAPIIFPSMAIHEAVARKLQAETGRDWRSSLVISGTHTHSGPARFWQIPDPDDVTGPGLGLMGIGEYHDQAYQWLVDSLSEAAMDALADLAPAKMGWDVVESFDVDDAISSDRRSETPPFDDNRILLIRIDDMDDNPRGLLISFGTHGTIHSDVYANNDALVGAEHMLEYALGDAYDRHVPVMYFNQNGGSMSPRGGKNGHEHTQRFENLGAHLVDRTFEAIETMDTTDDWSLDGHSHRFPIIHEYLDYAEGEFEEYIYGGLMCSPDGGDDYHTHGDPSDYGCLGLHALLGHRPTTLFAKSQISAFQLNDLTLVTMPGELTMPLGWQIQRELREAYDIDPFHSFTWGYAQDHLLYLLPTNLRGELPPFPGISTPQAPDDYPDYAFSYLQGGYEASMSPWGHNTGDFMVNRALEAVGLMRGDEIEPQFEVPYPDEFTARDHPPFEIDGAANDEVGIIVEAPSGEVERRQPVEVAWRGGDPGAEMPQAPRAILERFDDGDQTFEPVMLANHRPYDNRAFVMLTRLRHDAQQRPEWVIYWEELADFPTGTYRFRIAGHYWDADSDERTPYETTTDPFDLVPTTALAIDELNAVDDQTLSFRVSYPPANELRGQSSSEDPGAVNGSYRMHHRHTPTGAPIAVDEDYLALDQFEIDVDRAQGPPVDVADLTATTNTDGGVPTTWITLVLSQSLEAGDSVDVEIRARDVHDNTGYIDTTVEFE